MSGVKINQSFNQLQGKREDAVSKAEFNALVSKISAMKQTLERSVSSAALTTLITQTVAAGGGGGSSSGSTVKTVTKSVTAGVTYNEVFDAPSLLLTLPIAYVTIDSLMSHEFPIISSLTVNGFTIVPIQDATLLYSYVNL